MSFFDCHSKSGPIVLLIAFLSLSVTTQAVALEKRVPLDSDVQCFTTMGLKSVLQKDVPTHFKTFPLTVTYTKFNHIHPVATLELKDQTTTKTVVATGQTALDGLTTPPAVTKTVTTTKTVTKLSTSTTTVATSPGFKPVRSTLPKPTLPSNPDARAGKKDASLIHPPSKFAQEVECVSHTTTTITTTVVTKHNPSSTTTIYGASVITSYPISGIAATTTKTVTKTTTSTQIIPGPTIYASCLQDNMYTIPNSTFTILEASGNYYYLISSSAPKSAYDCCALCFTKFHCVGGQYQPILEEKTTQCLIYANNMTTPQISTNLTADYYQNYGPAGDLKNPIFNGDCGEYTASAYDPQ